MPFTINYMSQDFHYKVKYLIPYQLKVVPSAYLPQVVYISKGQKYINNLKKPLLYAKLEKRRKTCFPYFNQRKIKGPMTNTCTV